MFLRCCVFLLAAVLPLAAAPVIDPIANVTVPAGQSLIVPITATVTNGRALTYTITGSTNAIAIVVHTNNPFWKLHVVQASAADAQGAFPTPFRGGTVTATNVGDLTFMLFPEYAPQTVSIFQGLSAAGFFNSNTIFHRVVTNFVIQGGDPLTNGMGGLGFQYNDEFHPQAIFSGNGQLALANSGKDTDGSQFFVTVGPQRFLDFQYTLFGQLVRGFDVLTNIDRTAVDTNSRPLAMEIITQAGLVPDGCDTVITLTATNRAKITNMVTVVASDGVGGFATNTFKAATVTDTNGNGQPFILGNTVTNLVAPLNVTLTNYFSAMELTGQELYWFVYFGDESSETNTVVTGNYLTNIYRNLTYNVTNLQGQLQLFVKPVTNFAGPVSLYVYVSTNASWSTYYSYYPLLGALPPYDQMVCVFHLGDTAIIGQAAPVPPLPPGAFTNLLLATFTNGAPGSAITNFSASVQWGDDSITAALIATNAAGGKQVLGAHNYTNSGVYPLVVTIQSSGGATAGVSNAIAILPALTLVHSATNDVLNWPAWAFGYALQANTNLAGDDWLTVTNPPVLAGFQNVVSNAAASQNFYRLGR